MPTLMRPVNLSHKVGINGEEIKAVKTTAVSVVVTRDKANCLRDILRFSVCLVDFDRCIGSNAPRVRVA